METPDVRRTDPVGPTPGAARLIAQIKRSLHLLVIATVVLFVVEVASVGYFATVAAKNQDALCTLRDDLQVRIDQSNAFLRSHPHGAFGIPAAVIQQQINNSQRSIDALSNLSC